MQLSANDFNALAQLALKAAETAATYIQSQVKKTHDIQLKSGVENLATQVVTAIDLESQRLIMEELMPTIEALDLGLLTEELPDDGSRFTKDYFWCIDPLDGTLPFTEQQPGYAVSIALVNNLGESIIGIVVDPYHQTRWLGIKGRGVQRNAAPYTKLEPSDVLVCCMDRSFEQSAHYQKVLEGLQQIRELLGYKTLQINTGYGAVMNAISLLDSASGCYFKLPKAKRGGGCIWDYAATSLIYEELGLNATTAHGDVIMLNRKEGVYMNHRGIVYAANRRLHQELIKLASQFE